MVGKLSICEVLRNNSCSSPVGSRRASTRYAETMMKAVVVIELKKLGSDGVKRISVNASCLWSTCTATHAINMIEQWVNCDGAPSLLVFSASWGLFRSSCMHMLEGTIRCSRHTTAYATSANQKSIHFFTTPVVCFKLKVPEHVFVLLHSLWAKGCSQHIHCHNHIPAAPQSLI